MNTTENKEKTKHGISYQIPAGATIQFETNENHHLSISIHDTINTESFHKTLIYNTTKKDIENIALALIKLAATMEE